MNSFNSHSLINPFLHSFANHLFFSPYPLHSRSYEAVTPHLRRGHHRHPPAPHSGSDSPVSSPPSSSRARPLRYRTHLQRKEETRSLHALANGLARTRICHEYLHHEKTKGRISLHAQSDGETSQNMVPKPPNEAEKVDGT